MVTSTAVSQQVVLPTFLGIGPYKSGTTWLYKCLQEHPEAFLPDLKEINFFNIKDGRDRIAEKGFDWYFGLYKDAEFFPARGDVSPGILTEPRAPGLIREHLPDCKLITILRNPVDRAISDYHYLHAKGSITCSLEELLRHPERFLVENERIIQSGFYYRHLSRFLEVFPSSDLLIIPFEDLKRRPDALFGDVCEFLCIDTTVQPASLSVRVNPARRLRSKTLESLGGRTAAFLREHHMEDFWRSVKNSGFPAMIHRLNRIPVTNPTPPPSLRQELQGIYEDDIRHLGRVTGFPVHPWLC